jgi:voltage-gated potassium channel
MTSPDNSSQTEERTATNGRARALKRFEELTAVPMLILSLAIIPLIVVPLTVELSKSTERAIIAIDWIIWAVFAVEYVVRLFLSPRKLIFVRRNLLDLFIVLLPFLRPLRIVRSARLFRVLRALRAVAFLARGARTVRAVLTGKKIHYALVFTMAVVLGAGLLVESFERGAKNAEITSIPDALWWAVTTVTTVGYGDLVPVTAAGRGVAVALMIVGIALFGFIAGSLASFFLETSEEKAHKAEEDQLQEIAGRLDRIERLLSNREGGDGSVEELFQHRPS